MHVDKISRPYMQSRRTTKAKNKNFICINVYYYYYKVGGKGGGGGYRYPISSAGFSQFHASRMP